MTRVAWALFVTAMTVALWLAVVRGQDRAAQGRAEQAPEAKAPEAQAEGCRIGYVYDGDTVALECGEGEVTARLIGLDTPETRDARCAAEKALGDRATERLRALVRGARQIDIRRDGYGKYGRALIALRIDGTDVADWLVGEGLAVRYDRGRRPDWCARLGE